ncbi:MAG: 3-deoxy-8-phosphooctulonate synthase [Planctomycetota bacterium]
MLNNAPLNKATLKDATPNNATRICSAGSVSIGGGGPLTVIGGPCTHESLELGRDVGSRLRDACAQHGLGYIFKASYDKANRSSIASARGPGLAQGLDWLAEISEHLSTPVTTDVHLPDDAARVASCVDLVQIPAFLCRQSDLLLAAGQAAASNGCGVNVKKGQFLSPREMTGPVRKLSEAGCENTMVTERGTFFGYHRLVNDFTGLGDLMELDCSGWSDEKPPPVCFDVTHSTQLPGSGEQTGGRPDRAPLLAKAAVAAGVAAVFIECHPDPKNAASDGATQLPVEQTVGLLAELARLHGALAETSPAT